MKKQQINLVWIKRDIRSQDHLPFDMAEKSVLPYLSIFVFEPTIIAYPDTSVKHLQFQYHSLLQLNQKLRPNNKSIHIFHTDIIQVLTIIQQQYEIVNLYSYQESGIQLTYDRDKFGKLKVSMEACKQRDIFVFSQLKKNKIPVAVTLGGGYSPDIKTIVEAHCNTFRTAADLFD